MASLTEVAINTRKVIKLSIFFIIFIIIGRIFFNFGYKIYRSIFPKPPPPPTVAFGKLPSLPFPEKKDLPKFEYTLETATGEFPTFPTQSIVYFMPKVFSKLSSLDEAKAKANAMGFTQNPERVSESIYRFRNQNAPSVFEINTVTQTFSVSFDLAADPEIIKNPPPSLDTGSSIIRSLLTSAQIFPDDLSGPTLAQYFRLEGSNFIDVISLSEANFIRINFFRKGYVANSMKDEYKNVPSVTSDPEKANVWFLLSGSGNSSRSLISGEYHYFPIDQEQVATYPIKTAQAAYNELVAGNGYIARQNKTGATNISVRNIYLGYYDSGLPMDFYQPVYVFEDSKGFTAYVPAVTTEYYGN